MKRYTDSDYWDYEEEGRNTTIDFLKEFSPSVLRFIHFILFWPILLFFFLAKKAGRFLLPVEAFAAELWQGLKHAIDLFFGDRSSPPERPSCPTSCNGPVFHKEKNT